MKGNIVARDLIKEHYGIELTEREKTLMHVYSEIVKQLEKSEQHGKWTKETVWIYRNDRGDIMRAQDEHPAAASEEVERIYRSDANESDHERL